MKQIHQLLHQLGMRSTYTGFQYLAHAIELSLNDDKYLRQLTTSLYPTVAEHYDATPAAVARSLRTLINDFWKRGNMEYFEQITYYHMPEKPHTGQLIGILVEYMKINS